MSSAVFKKNIVQMFAVEIIDYAQTKTLWVPKFNIVYTYWTSKTDKTIEKGKSLSLRSPNSLITWIDDPVIIRFIK